MVLWLVSIYIFVVLLVLHINCYVETHAYIVIPGDGTEHSINVTNSL